MHTDRRGRIAFAVLSLGKLQLRVLLAAEVLSEDMMLLQHRCVSIFVDRKVNPAPPVGFALGSIEGRVAIQYVNPTNPKDNFTFKCHRSNGTATTTAQDIYAVC